MREVFHHISDLVQLTIDSVVRWLRDAVPWHGALSEHSLVIATWSLTIVTIALVIVTYLVVRHERKKRKEARRQVESLLRVCRVKDFDPGQVVGAYTAANVTEYLPIPQDVEIEKALKMGYDILIGGRPGIGKSHTAVWHLSTYRKWFLIRPAKHALDNLHLIRLRRRRYILFLDDLHEYSQPTNAPVKFNQN